jgi:hypothetical protein
MHTRGALNSTKEDKKERKETKERTRKGTDFIEKDWNEKMRRIKERIE